jgi:hypothetical protein
VNLVLKPALETAQRSWYYRTKELVLRHLQTVLECKGSHETYGGSSFKETETRRFLTAACNYGIFVPLETTGGTLNILSEVSYGKFLGTTVPCTHTAS